ncbi:M23 family metallopeptidase [Candidatus Micrarchaeota archaeon]|nr:M23 family metallopeptidase [Candidatus Micrarchaeota archaeon]
MEYTTNKYSLPVPRKSITKISHYSSPAHRGFLRQAVDFIVPLGTSVYAAAGGIVVDMKENSSEGGKTKHYDTLGNFIEIKHNNEEYSLYEHLEPGSSKVSIGQRVKRGQKIGKSGATGWIAHLGPHLHFAVGKYVDLRSLKVKWNKRSVK